MDLYLTEPVGPFHQAVGTAFGTFTTRQDVSPTDLPCIPGQKLRKGSKIWVSSYGEFSTTGTPNLTLGLYIGTVAGAITIVLAESSVIVTGSGAAAWPWHMEWVGIVVGVGTTGSIVGEGYLDIGTSLTASTRTPIPVTAALRTVAIDTTIARAVGVCATWGTSSGSNTVKTNVHHVGILN
jgi:hypothetical protein